MNHEQSVPTVVEGSTGGVASLDSDLQALHRATLSLVSDLSLDGVLRRVIHAARDLSNAKYAAIGIPSGDGDLTTFITEGLSQEQRDHISIRPQGHGLIGEMLRTGESIRVANIADHPKSVGFPEGHPVMRSFLGVPIKAYGRSIGQIYLTDKIGEPEFSVRDQHLIEMLAAHAVAAIENARLYQKVLGSEHQLAERNEELGLMYSMATAVSSSMDLDRLLEVILGRVMNIFHADAGEMFLLEESEGVYRKAIHIGGAPDAFWEIDRFRIGEGVIGQVALTGSLKWTNNLREDDHFLRKAVVESGYQTLVCAPLIAPGRVTGVLSLAFKGRRPIEDQDVGLLGAVGAGVGIAVENARLYRRARRVAVLEERERIGMDLHDGIIQSIYAIGLGMEYTRLTYEDKAPEAASRLEKAIEGLNKVIRDIRTYILDLQPSRIRTGDLSEALERLVREFKANTLVEVELKVDEEVLKFIQDQPAEVLFHIAQEALANTAKHARASRVLVNLRQSSNSDITLQIIDNGQGFEVESQPDLLGHGLSNMDERARQLGGEFDVISGPGEGTTVTVRIPQDRLIDITPRSTTQYE
ncbi:MAG: GAF domain-containing sensor histidine kinase [Anaerolineales bacterium]|nr:GAF domain-containing sensor histidine kinase [Anaerolineales bacterium]MCK5634345.1 GAF domain-containing sensor histidine kinase [Anaerolineales bacterium]